MSDKDLRALSLAEAKAASFYSAQVPAGGSFVDFGSIDSPIVGSDKKAGFVSIRGGSSTGILAIDEIQFKEKSNFLEANKAPRYSSDVTQAWGGGLSIYKGQGWIEFDTKIPATKYYQMKVRYFPTGVFASDGLKVYANGELVNAIHLPANPNSYAQTNTVMVQLKGGMTTLKLVAPNIVSGALVVDSITIEDLNWN